MYLKVYKEEIIEGLQKASNIIPQRTGAAYLRSIWLKAENERLEFLATDSNIEFRGSYPSEVIEGGLIGVQGRSFIELLRCLPDGQVSLKTDDETPVLHVEQGKRKYKLAVNDSSWFQKFSDFPDEGSILWSGDFLQEIIEKISYCIGDESKDELSCMIIKPSTDGSIEAAGMNGHQFAMLNFSNDDLVKLLPADGILMQKKYLGELKKWLGNAEINVNIASNRLFLQSENKFETLSLPLSSYQYPDYSVFISRLDKEGDSVINLSRADLQDSLQRIRIFNNESNRCTYFELAPTEALLTAKGQDVGSAAENIEIEYTGKVNRIAFPTSNLSGILEHFTSSSLKFTMTGNEGPCGISGKDDNGYLVIIMPMKILDEIQLSEEQV